MDQIEGLTPGDAIFMIQGSTHSQTVTADGKHVGLSAGMCASNAVGSGLLMCIVLICS